MVQIQPILPDKKFCRNASRKLHVCRFAGVETAEW